MSVYISHISYVIKTNDACAGAGAKIRYGSGR